MEIMLRITIGVMKAIDRRRISVVSVTKVAKKARIIAARNNFNKPTAVLTLMLSGSVCLPLNPNARYLKRPRAHVKTKTGN